MIRFKTLLAWTAMVFIFSSYDAKAENACVEFLHSPKDPISIKVIYDAFKKLPAKKDEYEKTAQFIARRKLILNSVLESLKVNSPSSLLFSSKVIETNPIFQDVDWKYDADTEELVLNTFVTDQMPFGSKREELHHNKSHMLGDIYFDSYTYNMYDGEVYRSTYTGVNGFGAEVDVKKTYYNFWGIAAATKSVPKRISHLVLKLPPRDAKELTENARILLGFKVVPPYEFEVFKMTNPTFSEPEDTSVSEFYVAADLQCAVVYNGKSREVAYIMK